MLPLAAVLPILGLQAAAPGTPEENGLTPVSETFYVNTPDTLNNGKTESLGVAVARNGNVIIGWEDDGEGLADQEAVWTLFGPSGSALTATANITTIDPAFAGQTLSSRFLSYFRQNGTPISGRTSWGPKIKANLFGDGLGMGATSFELANEVVEFGNIQNNAAGENAGDFPSVQLLDNAGGPLRILSGLSDEYAERPGDIRIGDWDYLSTGDVVIAGESRQRQDLPEIYGGATGEQTHAIVRVVGPTGVEVKAVQLASELADKSEMWHGVGVTKSGFALRFANELGRATVRVFSNSGQAGTNMDLATLAGSEVLAGGGRGDGAGFHGNGNDAYAAVAAGTGEEGVPQVWVAVLNADGTLRWSRNVSDDIELTKTGSCDVGIDAAGRVVVVYDDTAGTGGNASLVLGRAFDAKGTPLGGTFHVSEKELPDPNTLGAAGPRVAVRNGSVAVIWESLNSIGAPETTVVAARLFSLSAMGGIETAGLTRIVPDKVIYKTDVANLDNWEPYSSVLGTSTFLVSANTFAESSSESQRFVLAFQPVAGGSGGLGEVFFGDDGQPYRGAINASRQDGNPSRITGDRRPGAVNFLTGGEASPHTVPAFQSDTRWDLGFERTETSRYATVEPYRLDPTTLVQTSLSKAFDATYGRATSGSSESEQITRFGGHMVALDDGNFAVVVEDRSKVKNPDGNAVVATIVAPDGSIVKESFVVANGDLWANVAAFKGGFAVRVAGIIHFLTNAGIESGSVDQDTSGLVMDRGRGDDVRLGGHINTPYVYLTGTVENSVHVAVFDSRDQTFVTEATVITGAEGDSFARADVDSDALGRIAVVFEVKPNEWEQSQVGLRVFTLNGAAKQLTALTPAFFPFINYAPLGIRTTTPTVSMTTRQILVAAKGEVNLENKPDLGPDSPAQTTLYTVFTHPDPQEDPTPSVTPGGDIKVSMQLVGNSLVLTWTGGSAPFKVQQRSSLSSGAWSDLTTTQGRTATIPISGQAEFVQVVGQ